MSNEERKQYIVDMVRRIEDEALLRRPAMKSQV